MSDPKPVRLQLSRRKGFRLTSPNGLPVVCVTRPGRWGNPFPTAAEYERWLMLDEGERAAIRRDLRGKNLACWCGAGKACHADVQLRVARSPGSLNF